MSQKEYIGFNSIDSLKSLLEQYSAKKVFLVIGKGSYSLCGAEKCIQGELENRQVVSFSDFSCNPKIEDLCYGIECFKNAGSDVVIAIGGGSVIDMAKMINFFAGSKIQPKAYIKGKTAGVGKSLPLIAIPTTSGTGSEATHFAVLYVGHEKYSIGNEHILPDIAIVDPQFTMSLPPKITASTGMDALSQAIESYWCINSNELSKQYAKEAILLIMSNLHQCVTNPDKVSKTAMSKAAHLAGKAINITKTTAAHAVSYPITSFFGVDHGHAVGLTLASFLVYNFNVTDGDVLDVRGAKYVKKTIKDISSLLGESDILKAKEKLVSLMKLIGLETVLSNLGIDNKGVELIIKNGFNPERVKNNPRMLDKKSLRIILHNIS